MKYYVETKKRLDEVIALFIEEGYTVTGIEGLCHCGQAEAVALFTATEDVDIQIVVCGNCYNEVTEGQRL